MAAAWVAVGVGQGLQIHLQPALHVEGLEGQCLPPHLQLELAELQRPEQQPLLLHAGLSLALEPPEVQLHRQHWQLILLLQLQEQLSMSCSCCCIAFIRCFPFRLRIRRGRQCTCQCCWASMRLSITA